MLSGTGADLPQTAARIVTLLTDFGSQDHFVGTMKGVILQRCPSARLVDLTHELELGDILGAALLLRAAAPYFPAGTVHLAIVDPGVGGPRRPLAVVSGAQLFVGPDNGLLWPAASREGTPLAFELREERYQLQPISATFHGRDLFAPAAAFLAAGVPPENMGPLCADPQMLSISAPVARDGGMEGQILWIDRFGNAVTNLTPAAMEGSVGRQFALRAGSARIAGPSSHYAAVGVGEPLVVLGSLGYFEIAVHRDSAAARLGLTRGQRVVAEPIG